MEAIREQSEALAVEDKKQLRLCESIYTLVEGIQAGNEDLQRRREAIEAAKSYDDVLNDNPDYYDNSAPPRNGHLFACGPGRGGFQGSGNRPVNQQQWKGQPGGFMAPYSSSPSSRASNGRSVPSGQYSYPPAQAAQLKRVASNAPLPPRNTPNGPPVSQQTPNRPPQGTPVISSTPSQQPQQPSRTIPRVGPAPQAVTRPQPLHTARLEL